MKKYKSVYLAVSILMCSILTFGIPGYAAQTNNSTMEVSSAIEPVGTPTPAISEPAASFNKVIIQGTLSKNNMTEANTFNLVTRERNMITLTGNTKGMENNLEKSISVVGSYQNMNTEFYVETFVLDSVEQHQLISNNLKYFNNPNDSNGNTDQIQGNAVICWDSTYVNYFKASVATSTKNFEIHLVDILSTTDPQVRTGIFNIYSDGVLVEKCIKGTLYGLDSNNPDSYFKFYSDGTLNKQWHVSGWITSRYDYCEWTPTPHPDFPPKLGDLNNDYRINSIDCVILLKYIYGMYDYYIAFADLNKDGLINSTDLAILKRIILQV